MSKDPFEAIGKVDGARTAGGPGGLQSLSFPPSAPSGQTNESSGGGISATDEVHFSADVDQADEPGGSEAVSGLVNAWGPTSVTAGGGSQAPGFEVSQGPQEGLTAGAVMGPKGVTGQEPGMQAGGVFTLRPPAA